MVGLSALAVGVYAAKRGTAVVARVVEARVAKPSLVYFLPVPRLARLQDSKKG